MCQRSLPKLVKGIYIQIYCEVDFLGIVRVKNEQTHFFFLIYGEFLHWNQFLILHLNRLFNFRVYFLLIMRYWKVTVSVMFMSKYHFIMSFHKNKLIRYASLKLQGKSMGKQDSIREFSLKIRIALSYNVTLF